MTEFVIRSTRHRTRANHRAGDALRLFVETLKVWHRRSRERGELARFNEYQLHDIGLSRSLITAEIDKPFWRP